MTPAEIIRKANSEGVALKLSPTGNIRAAGGPAAVNRWVPILRKHKPAIVALLSAPPMTAQQAAAIRTWLALIGENDPETLGEVMAACERDAEARSYFMARSAEPVETFGMVLCIQCAAYRRNVCTVAEPCGLVNAAKGYERAQPARLHRCKGCGARDAT